MKQLLFMLALVVTMGLALNSSHTYAFTTKRIQLRPSSRKELNIKNGTSSNWSGYAVESNLKTPTQNSVTNVSGQWVVPALSCSRSSTYSSVWVGIDGYSDNTVEQTGTEQDCQRSKPVYYVWFETYPQYAYEVNLPVAAGNTVSASVIYSANNQYAMTVKNITTGQSFSTTRTLGGAQRESAEWIAEAPSSNFGVLPLSDFGHVNFTNASADISGHIGGIADPAWQNDAITMLVNSRISKATPSVLSGTDGNTFSVAWDHN